MTDDNSDAMASAPIDEVDTFEVDSDTAEVTVTADCTLNGADQPVRCMIEFGADGTQSVRVSNGSTPTDIMVDCPRPG